MLPASLQTFRMFSSSIGASKVSLTLPLWFIWHWIIGSWPRCQFPICAVERSCLGSQNSKISCRTESNYCYTILPFGLPAYWIISTGDDSIRLGRNSPDDTASLHPQSPIHESSIWRWNRAVVISKYRGLCQSDEIEYLPQISAMLLRWHTF